jgi:type VI protein secretion system component VasK
VSSIFTKLTLTRNTFDCRVDKDGIQWSEDSKRILNTANAGGNSQYSEALSNELISTLTRGRLLKTEMEIEYFPMGGKITDFCMEIDGQPIGVSVTRALKFRGQFTEKDATSLLTKKLDGINQSTR